MKIDVNVDDAISYYQQPSDKLVTNYDIHNNFELKHQFNVDVPQVPVFVLDKDNELD